MHLALGLKEIFILANYRSNLTHQKQYSLSGELPIQLCGAAVFRLSDVTLAAIKDQEQEFFESAQESRDTFGGTRPHPTTYDNWRKTPIPQGWLSEGIEWFGLHCVQSIHNRTVKEIVRHSIQTGS